MTTDKMEGARGGTGGRTRTVYVETGQETDSFAEALALRDAPTPDIGVPARTAGGGYAYAAWLARAERLAGTCDRPGSAWLKSAILGFHGPSSYPTPLPLYFVFDPYHANPHLRRSSL